MSHFKVGTRVDSRGSTVVVVEPQGYGATVEMLPTEVDKFISDLQQANNSARAANRPKVRFGDH